MNLSEILKQFKNLEPDAAFKEKSKRAILASLPPVTDTNTLTPRIPVWNLKKLFLGVFETGFAIALGVFFILLVTGQISNIPYVSPVQFSVINPETLHAEAQAVDIQIQLAQVAYKESTTTVITSGLSTAATIAPPGVHVAFLIVPADSSSTATGTAATASSSDEFSATSTPSSTLSVDQALQALSK